MRTLGSTRSDRGEGAVSYIAILCLIALITSAVVVTSTGTNVAENLNYAVCEVIHAGHKSECESPADKAFTPAKCTVDSATNSYGATFDIAFFQVGKNLTFIRTTDSSGKVTVTAVDNTSAGVGTGVGVGINWGKSVNIGADADAKAGITVGVGNSWVFNNQAEADKFIGDIQARTTIDSVENSGPIGWLGGQIYDAVAGPDAIPDPNTTRTEFSIDASAGVSAGITLGPPNKDGSPLGSKGSDGKTVTDTRGSNKLNPNLNVYAKISAGDKVIIENNKDGSSAVTYQITGGAEAGDNHVVGQDVARAKATGAMKMSYDKDGKLTSVTFTQTHLLGGNSTVVTTTLPITNDQDRKTVEDGLMLNNYGLPGAEPLALALTWDDMAPTQDPGPNGTALDQLLYNKAQTQKVDYTYTQNDLSYGAKVKLGLKLGIGVSLSSQDQKLTGTPQYLGAPQGDGTRPFKNFKECHA